MSDDRQREAERRWRETGAVEDLARYLSLLVRHGSLHSDRLGLAALLGDPAARMAVGQSGDRRELQRLLSGEEPWRREAAIRIALAAARACWPAWRQRFPQHPAPRQAIEAVEAWLGCPCVHHARRAEEAEALATEAVNSVPANQAWGAKAAKAAVAAVADDRFRFFCAKTAQDYARQVVGAAPLEQALCADVVEWLLGLAQR